MIPNAKRIRAAIAGLVLVLLASERAWGGPLPANDLVITGGDDATGFPIDNTDIFDPASRAFSAGPMMAQPRLDHAQIPLGGSFVLVAGGLNNFAILSDAELLDRTTDTFIPTGSMTIPRGGPAFAMLDSMHALVAGGETPSNIPPSPRVTASAEVYSLKTGTFSPTGSMNVARIFPSTAKISHFVLVTGGEDGMGRVLSSAELYDAKAGTFSVLPDMSMARVSHSSVAINSQFVVIMGGSFSFPSSAELFNLKTRSFTALPNMHVGRVEPAAARVNGSTVLITGGLNFFGMVNKSAEIFDLTKKTFTAVGDMSVPRRLHTAVSMSGGKVLVAGGEESLSVKDATNTAEIFSPATKSFTPVGDMTTARFLPDASPF